ncbi:hypothetical protein [Paraburkholderia azotifigens]|uniref:Uncharacterized protein n=2 Tax=Paraburkholderia azotifigens TaxID=2057004 RepID=A0A5C6VD99_9BURK|nr:hypothetical protein FRZ40_43255 [Paraburkholderia azotifigens]
MNSTMVRSIRAHLITASIAATCINAVVLVRMFVFGVSESTFETGGFRIAVVAAVAIATGLTRLFALGAYRYALKQSGLCATIDEGRYVHGAGRFRALVSLHLRFSGV